MKPKYLLFALVTLATLYATLAQSPKAVDVTVNTQVFTVSTNHARGLDWYADRVNAEYIKGFTLVTNLDGTISTNQNVKMNRREFTRQILTNAFESYYQQYSAEMAQRKEINRLFKNEDEQTIDEIEELIRRYTSASSTVRTNALNALQTP